MLIGLVVAIGVRWGSPAGMAAGLAEGWLQGSLAGRSLALLALVGIAVGFMAGRFDARIFRPSWLGVSLAAGVFSLLTQLALGPPSPPAGDFSPGWWLPVLLVFGSSLYTALVSPGLDLLIRKWGGE